MFCIYRRIINLIALDPGMVTIDTSDLVGWGAFGVLLTAYVISKVIKIESEAKQIQQNVDVISNKINESLEFIEQAYLKIEMPSINLDEIKEEMLDTIQDFVGNLETPRWQDHLMGMAQQFLQMKMMNAMPPQVAEMMPTLADSIIDPGPLEGEHAS